MPYRLITPPPRTQKIELPVKKRGVGRPFFFSVITVGLLFFAWTYLRPLPTLQATELPFSLPPTAAVSLPWPNYGQSAIGAKGFGVLATHRPQISAPMASIAKIVTALSVLQKKPLGVGLQGPTLIISQEDLDAYDNYFAKGGSIVPVRLGENISEYQALQAMLLPSANNIADMLARWAFGSINNYTAYANQLVDQLGLTQTHIADAGGLAPKTVSSAQDLVKLGLAALNNPVVAQIVKQAQATIPVAGVIKNTNGQLGTAGVIGLKTGDTDQAGGCYLFAANRSIQNHQITIVGAVMGGPGLVKAMLDSTPLIKASDQGFEDLTVINAGQVVGQYKLPWDGTRRAIVKESTSLLVWRGSIPKSTANLASLRSPKNKGDDAGSISLSTGYQTKNIPVALENQIEAPSLTWRLFH